ncbi:uncharacterized protein LOC101892787 [Musca domestica]|uniref:Uncharacterized protein LOC101892787 n=1 Tax=Musca domestica TaxID=7370 RepID=A0A1I8N1D1_MUSDO|nr:uncharacterized protein LOC101892787 [Musca domestica]
MFQPNWIILSWIIILFFIATVAAIGSRYEFVFENDKVFDVCPDEENSNGVHDLFDISGVSFEFSEGSIHISGDLTCVWEGVEPGDRIENRIELFKLVRSSWQPTPFSMSTTNFCESFFSEKYLFYQVWSKYIVESDRQCITTYKHVFHLLPYDIDTILDYPINMEGRHKVVVHFTAFDENNQKRPNVGCFEIHGEFFRAK